MMNQECIQAPKVWRRLHHSAFVIRYSTFTGARLYLALAQSMGTRSDFGIDGLSGELVSGKGDAGVGDDAAVIPAGFSGMGIANQLAG